MARKELGEKASQELWKVKKSDAIAFEEGKQKPIEDGEYVLGAFVATENAIKDSDAVTFHYRLEGTDYKLFTKHINGTTVDNFKECYIESAKGGHYVIPRNRYQNVLLSQMNSLKGRRVRISQDTDGKAVKFVKGGYNSEEEAKKAYEQAKIDKIYKVEFL